MIKPIYTAFAALGWVTLVHAYPSAAAAGSSSDLFSSGRIIVPPPPPTDTGIKQIPDASHPFIAPGPNDLRGPCPGLNTMANHGYIPRNGVASFEEIITGAAEAFNMEQQLASALASFGMLARGNAFVDLLSIGLPTPLVPPLPGNIDGPQALGLATHGRFEGDVSMTRQDAAIGDNRNFQEDLYDALLAVVAELGDNSTVTGPNSIVTTKVMQEFKFRRFNTDQAADPKLEYHVGRFSLSYGEAAFTLNFFANGTDKILSVPTMSSFFRNQTFPKNWHRSSVPVGFAIISNSTGDIISAHPEIVPGVNNASGQYVPDVLSDSDCGTYLNLAQDNLPAVLANTTGVLKKNFDLLMQLLNSPFAPCPIAVPAGAAGI